MSDFHYDPFYMGDGGGEADELSKFESFMQQQQQHSQRNVHRQQQQAPTTNNSRYHRHDGFSPRSEDGMSYVSRMKHKNYAKVVQEMKMKQSGDDDADNHGNYNDGGRRQQQQQQGGSYGDARQQQQQQHQQMMMMQSMRMRQQLPQQPQQQRNDRGFDANFNSGNEYFAQQHAYQNQQHSAAASGYSQQQQRQQQQQQNYYNGRPMTMSSPQPLAPSRADRSPAYNHQHNNTNNNSNNPNVSNDRTATATPTRTGRKLFQDPSDSHARRSRSTVRRTADRTLQLAMLASNTDSHDTMSDVGSVFSSYSVGGESLAGFPLQSNQHQQQYRQSQFNRQSSGHSHSSSKSLSNSLDAFVAKSKSSNNHNHNFHDDENCSMISGASGAGSVAARRRAARQFPPQHNYNGRGSDFNTTPATPIGSKPRAIAPLPLHESNAYLASPGAASVASSTTSSVAAAGAVGSARSRMRMRMQQAATTSSNVVTSGRMSSSGDPSSPGIVKQPSQHLSHQQQQQQQPPPQAKNSKPILFNASAANDFTISSDTIEHEVNLALSELKLSHPEIIDVDFISTISRMESGGSTGDGSNSSAIGGGGGFECGGGSRGGSGSMKGAMLKKNSGGGAGTGRISPHTVSTKSMTIMNSIVVDLPTASSTAVTTTATGQNALISPVISVEQYSESSSLTDDVGSDGNNNNRYSGGSNIFKDAERMGSTFHKSKKIIRPGESVIPEERQISSGAVSKQPSTATPPLPPSPSTSSVRDRISDLNKESPAVGVAARAQSNRFPRVFEEASSPSPSTSAAPTVLSKVNRLPSSTPSTPPPSSSSVISSPNIHNVSTGGNPFAVKLRKTNLPPLGATPNIARSSPPQFKKETNDSTIDTATTSSVATPVATSSPVILQSRQENVNNSESPNPFLAGIKLRPAFGVGANDTPREKEQSDIAELETMNEPCKEDVVMEGTKQKLTYREHQELIRQHEGRQEEGEESTHSSTEAPKKDVAALIRERIAANKGKASPLPDNVIGGRGIASNINNASSVNTITKPCATTTPGHDQKDSTDTVASSTSEKEPDPDPRAALMAMLNKRGAPTIESISAPRSTPMKSEENNKSAAKNALSAMFAERAKKESGVTQYNSRDESKNALLSSLLANRAPPQASSGNRESQAGQSVERNSVVSTGNSERPALKNDPKYEKYFKMLKMGMPLPAVQHAMTRDGLDPSVMDGDHNLPEPQRVPLKDDPTYSKYFKMLKLGLPMGAVKNAMERDGIDPSIMDGDHNAPVSSSTSKMASSSNNKKQKDTHRRTRLHWDTLEDTKVNSNSVWALVGEDAELNQIEIDEQEFTTLFQAEIKSENPAGGAGAVGTGGGGGSSNRNVVQVIDPKRANNGGIILARLRMSYDDMARAVETIDETAMTANQAQGIIEYMPTHAERESLRDHMKNSKDGEEAAKSFERLCECEKFMVAMMTVKQSKRKIRALLFKLQFRGCIHDLARDVFLIEKACDELSNSVRLRKLFGIVLNIGNRLNTAGPGQKRRAGAFSIKSLLKLNQAKAFDNKTTFLHYVVLVVQRNNEALLDFKDDLPTVSKADKIYWDQCISELEEIETQLENVRKVSLHEAKSSKIMYQLPKKKKPAEADNDSDDLSVESMSLEDEVQLLRSTKTGMFALSAIRKVSQLRERVDGAKEKFASLLDYFGESGNTKMQPNELFEIINTFCRTFNVARAEVEKMEKVKRRDDKKGNDSALGTKNEKLKVIQEVQSPDSIKSPSTKMSTPLQRASSLQPSMGNVLADLKRASTAKFSSPGNKSSPAIYGDGPPRVQHRHPDDESSPGASDGRPHASSSNSVHGGVHRVKPSAPSPQNQLRHVQGDKLAEKVDERAREEQQVQSMVVEVARLANEEAEKRIAEERANAEEAARRALLEEAAAAEEAVDRAVQQRRNEVADAKKAVASAGIDTTSLQHSHQTGDGTAVQQPRHPQEAVASESVSENLAPDPMKTRRDMMLARRERARSRQPQLSSSPKRSISSSGTSAAVPSVQSASHSSTAALSSPKRSMSSSGTSAAVPPVQSASHSSTAAARERYARHKKMLQQRRV